MTYAFLFLLIGVGVVSSVPVHSDVVIVNIKPISNARFKDRTSDLHGTNVVGHYKLKSVSSIRMRDVFVENINDINPTNLLFCPRTNENPYMALHINTSTNQQLVCKEKLASNPLRLWCQINLLQFGKCGGLYTDNIDLPQIFSSSNQPFILSSSSMTMPVNYLATTVTVMSDLTATSTTVCLLNFCAQISFLLIFLLCLICFFLFCILIFLVLKFFCKQFSGNKIDSQVNRKTNPTVHPTENDSPNRQPSINDTPRYRPEPNVSDPLMENH